MKGGRNVIIMIETNKEPYYTSMLNIQYYT